MGRATSASAVLMFLGLSGVVSSSANAQATEKQRMQLSQPDSTRVIAITTNDGSTFVGRIVAVRADPVQSASRLSQVVYVS